MITAIFLPSTADLLEAAEIGCAKGLKLYCDGSRSVLAREKPAGQWAQVAVKINPTNTAEVTPCTA